RGLAGRDPRRPLRRGRRGGGRRRGRLPVELGLGGRGVVELGEEHEVRRRGLGRPGVGQVGHQPVALPPPPVAWGRAGPGGDASGAPGVSGGAAAGGAAATGALAGFLAARAGAAAARLVSPRSMITFAPSWRTTCAPGARERSTIARSFPPEEPTRTRETSSS